MQVRHRARAMILIGAVAVIVLALDALAQNGSQPAKTKDMSVSAVVAAVTVKESPSPWSVTLFAVLVSLLLGHTTKVNVSPCTKSVAASQIWNATDVTASV